MPSARRRCFLWNPRRNSRNFFILSAMETFVPQITRWLSSSSLIGKTWDSEVNWPDWFSRTRTTSRRWNGDREEVELNCCPRSPRRWARGVAESLKYQHFYFNLPTWINHDERDLQCFEVLEFFFQYSSLCLHIKVEMTRQSRILPELWDVPFEELRRRGRKVELEMK